MFIQHEPRKEGVLVWRASLLCAEARRGVGRGGGSSEVGARHGGGRSSTIGDGEKRIFRRSPARYGLGLNGECRRVIVPNPNESIEHELTLGGAMCHGAHGGRNGDFLSFP